MGAISYYEQTGKALPEYKSFENSYKAQNPILVEQQVGISGNGAEPLFSQVSCNKFVYDLYNGGPGYMMIGGTFMAPGWNNRVSRFNPLCIWGFFGSFYDQTFYRQRMASLWGWGWTYIRFQGPYAFLDNRTSSVL